MILNPLDFKINTDLVLLELGISKRNYVRSRARFASRFIFSEGDIGEVFFDFDETDADGNPACNE